MPGAVHLHPVSGINTGHWLPWLLAVWQKPVPVRSMKITNRHDLGHLWKLEKNILAFMNDPAAKSNFRHGPYQTLVKNHHINHHLRRIQDFIDRQWWSAADVVSKTTHCVDKKWPHGIYVILLDFLNQIEIDSVRLINSNGQAAGQVVDLSFFYQKYRRLEKEGDWQKLAECLKAQVGMVEKINDQLR